MNARTRRADIFSTSPIHYASPKSHDETPLTALQNTQALVYLLLTSLSIYCFLDYLGLAPIPLVGFLWDLLVYLTPSRILVALDSRMSPSDFSPSNSSPMSFQAKSESMQRLLGLDTNTFPIFSRSRSLSGLGSTLLGANKEAVPPGLGNWDNSCYQNSVIQGFASLRSLSDFLRRNVDILGEKGSLATHKALKSIIDHLNSASNYGHKLWIPPDLKSMSSWQQQDAQEYFSKVVDQIDIEIRQASRGQTRNMGLKRADSKENILYDRANYNISSCQTGSNASIDIASFCNPLEGLLAQRVGCMTCGWTEGLSLIPFNCLTVPLGGRFEYDVRECLDQYMTLEPIEGVECANCTLLRAQQQLKSLLGGILEDEASPDVSHSAQLSDVVKSSALARLETVTTALEEHDFAEKTLADKCHIPSKNRVSTTKSRQAVIARAPQCLVVHINRSLFDEMTGMLKKNYAIVKFPKTLDLNDWCLGTRESEISEGYLERWQTNPTQSMLPRPGQALHAPNRHYELRAVITHSGRHENGHYICYRKYPTAVFPASIPDEVLQAEGDKEKPERWYRLSDDDVQMVSEANVMSQGGAFMLFYEAVEERLRAQLANSPSQMTNSYEPTESVTNITLSENLSAASTCTDADSSTSRATSISAPDRELSVEDSKRITHSTSGTSNAMSTNPQASTEDPAPPSFVTA